MNDEKQVQINRFLTEDSVRKFYDQEYDMDCIMSKVDYEKVGYRSLIIMGAISAVLVLSMIGIILIGG